MPTLECLPARVRAGDSLEILLELADYPGPTWELTYHARPVGGQATGWTWTGVEVEGNHLFELEPVDTAGLARGLYRVALVATQGSAERVTLEVITLEVLPDLTQSETDATSHARRMLAAVEALLERRATRIQESYTIEGRALKFLSLDELRRARNRYLAEVAVEDGRSPRGVGRSMRVSLR
jgi:hypothetical protein